MDTEKAVVFIESRGTELERARLRCILQGTPAPTEVYQDLSGLQNPDGGFPFDMHKGNLSTHNETTVALWWLEELELLQSQIAQQAFDYLLNTQQPDGSWDEDPRLAEYELPPWIKLNDPRTRLYLSAYVAYWLALGGRTSMPAFRKVLHFLARHQDETGKFLGYLHTTWIATAAFLMAGKRYAGISRNGMHVLSARELSAWEDSQIAWALDCLSQAGMPKKDPFVSKCLTELIRRQAADGSWASEDGEAAAVGASIQAIKVLKRHGFVAGDLQG